MESRPTIEFVGSESIVSKMLKHHFYKILLRDNKDGEGSVISARSILRMRVEIEEVPWCNMGFVSKVRCHQSLDEWEERIMAKTRCYKDVQQIGTGKPLTQARTLSMNMKHPYLEF